MGDLLGLGSMPDWLAHRASVTPNRLALMWSDRQWTYAELDADVQRMACRLATLGVGQDSPVATLLHNSPHVPFIVHAMSRLGSILVPLNIRLRPDEIAWQLGDSGARLLLVDSQTAPHAIEARERGGHDVQIISIDGGADDIACLDDVSAAEIQLRDWIDPSAIHSIVYTSGTTGRPKGAMLTYANHWWNAIGSALNLGMIAEDRWLACMPLFHVGGMAILLRSVIYGITAVIHPSFGEHAVNRAIDNDGITIVSVVATMLQRMLAAHDNQPYPSTFRCALLGGGPAPRPLLEQCASLGIPVVQTYGLTEVGSQVATLAPEDALARLGSAGKPLYPNELRIGDGDIPPGQPGEIRVRGPVVTAGYAGRPEATAAAIQDGWLHTGDLGYVDADGYLYVLDRRTDLIVSGGENVYPAEVEAALMAHPAVIEAGVIGIPDDDWGQTVVASVQLVSGTEVGTDALTAFCRERLAAYKVPRQVRLTGPLPRNAAGKLLRRELRDSWLTAPPEKQIG
ncbi:MAG: o-succinylbenzoate--CoA ligase [Nitrolancea sp.]